MPAPKARAAFANIVKEYTFRVQRRIVMSRKKKDRNLGMPVEKHDTAAWANIEKKKSHSRVIIPSEFQVINAKDYVDENEK
jgi:hypothetical protein